MGLGSERRSARLAIATCAELPDLDPEGRLLLERLAGAGIAAEAAVWDDQRVAWERFDRVLLRTTWDYPAHHQAFTTWVRARGEQVINPLPAVEWNLSKRYLTTLEAWGLPIVPTRLTAPGEPLELPDDGEFVVKPAVSAGSKDTARYGQGQRDDALAHARGLLEAGRDVITQPYLSSVDTDAETAVIVLGGRVSHAMRKAPLLELGQGLEEGLFREEDMQPREASAEQRALATAVVERFTREICAPTYARIDLLRSDAGGSQILELELIEPSLFLDHHPPAADRLVELLRPQLGL